MITIEDRGIGERLRAIDRVKWTTDMLKVQVMYPQMIADEMVDFVIEKMTCITANEEAQHEDHGDQQT